jgi:solute carrier family 25 (adenine nucleotide translocator) protein 4/5/6/31
VDAYLQQGIAAAGAGLVLSLSSPFDLVRNRLQTMGELVRQRRISTPFEGVLDCGRRVVKMEGLRGFWKGNLANLMRFYPNETFNFVTKECIQNWVRCTGIANGNSLAVNFVSGVMGAWMVLMFIYPFEFARTQLSNDLEGKGSIRSFLARTY